MHICLIWWWLSSASVLLHLDNLFTHEIHATDLDIFFPGGNMDALWKWVAYWCDDMSLLLNLPASYMNDLFWQKHSFSNRLINYESYWKELVYKQKQKVNVAERLNHNKELIQKKEYATIFFPRYIFWCYINTLTLAAIKSLQNKWCNITLYNTSVSDITKTWATYSLTTKMWCFHWYDYCIVACGTEKRSENTSSQIINNLYSWWENSVSANSKIIIWGAGASTLDVIRLLENRWLTNNITVISTSWFSFPFPLSDNLPYDKTIETLKTQEDWIRYLANRWVATMTPCQKAVFIKDIYDNESHLTLPLSTPDLDKLKKDRRLTDPYMYHKIHRQIKTTRLQYIQASITSITPTNNEEIIVSYRKEDNQTETIVGNLFIDCTGFTSCEKGTLYESLIQQWLVRCTRQNQLDLDLSLTLFPLCPQIKSINQQRMFFWWFDAKKLSAAAQQIVHRMFPTPLP